jgi:hypothetical protein
MDIIAVLLLGGVFSLGLVLYYRPKLEDLKKAQKNMFEDMKEQINSLSPEEKEIFFNSLGESEKNSFQFFVGSDFDDFQQQISMQQFEEFNSWAMSEGFKSVTPFDHGGNVMGPGFNPSETMAFESQQMDMNNTMNDFNNNSMNNF